MNHELKVWPEPHAAMLRGDKLFEFRRYDRPFRVGDTLHLREWKQGKYTGPESRWVVTYFLLGQFGVPEGFCAMGLKPTNSSTDTGDSHE